ncbi:uncharacterized protein [Parasteatoda tepidariorum]|uniref:uncharacterized protein n=1 Tax=Parasteatoda tepidariorum TaxID=114398 RepID=UPI00077F866E|nr:uncharacterized protein LOC107442873 [Parasteatoda tepidariorum]
MRRLRMFFLVLFALIQQHSVESFPPDIQNIDETDNSPRYNILKNLNEEVEVKANSLKEGNHSKFSYLSKDSNNTENFKENYNEFKDKSTIDDVTGQESTYLLRKSNFSTTPEPDMETNSTVTENYNSDDGISDELTDNQMTALSVHIDSWFGDEVNDVIIHDNGTSFTVMPSTVFVTEEIPELENDNDASIIPNSFENESYNSGSVVSDVGSMKLEKRSTNKRSLRKKRPKRDEESPIDEKKCRVPRFMKYSHLDCTIYSSEVKCNQTCVYGYVFNNHPARNRMQKCNRKKGKWSPSRSFSDCVPGYNCNVELKPGGKKYCKYNSMKHRPWCKIACSSSQNVKKQQKYKCSRNRKTGKPEWKPALPWCAKPETGT